MLHAHKLSSRYQGVPAIGVIHFQWIKFMFTGMHDNMSIQNGKKPIPPNRSCYLIE